jgi:hypothetical protein
VQIGDMAAETDQCGNMLARGSKGLPTAGLPLRERLIKHMVMKALDTPVEENRIVKCAPEEIEACQGVKIVSDVGTAVEKAAVSIAAMVKGCTAAAHS